VEYEYRGVVCIIRVVMFEPLTYNRQLSLDPADQVGRLNGISLWRGPNDVQPEFIRKEINDDELLMIPNP
jgi:hypothetical protein